MEHHQTDPALDALHPDYVPLSPNHAAIRASRLASDVAGMILRRSKRYEAALGEMPSRVYASREGFAAYTYPLRSAGRGPVTGEVRTCLDTFCFTIRVSPELAGKEVRVE